jgi:hypothetical protein
MLGKLPLITLEDENDFQWLAIGAVGMLIIVMMVVLVAMLRRYRHLERQAERMERRPDPLRPVTAEDIRNDALSAERLRAAARREPPEWQRYGGPG